MFHRGARQDALYDMREILEHQDGGGTRIAQLMFQFRRRVQRVGVDYRNARSQCSEHRDRILQNVRQHDGEPIAFLQACYVLQPGCESPRQLVELAVGHGVTHLHIGDLVGVARATALQQLLQGA